MSVQFISDDCCSPRNSMQDSLHALTSPLAGGGGAEKRIGGMLSPGEMPAMKKAR